MMLRAALRRRPAPRCPFELTTHTDSKVDVVFGCPRLTDAPGRLCYYHDKVASGLIA